MHYTIGKRRGFFVDGAHDPHYVIAIKPEENEIVVGTREKLQVNSFEVTKLNLFHQSKEFESVDALVSIDDNIASVKLKEPVYGLARGQVAVFYSDEKLLGGGIIS